MRRRPLSFLKVLWAFLLGRSTTIHMGRRRFTLFPDGTLLPVIAGGAPEKGEGEPGGEGEEKPEGGEEKPEKPEGEEKPPAGKGEGEEELGEGGKAALEKERKARRDAEKRAKEAEEKAKKYEDDQLSKEEKAEKRAKEAEEREASATAKVRRANLLTALAEDHKLTGAKAKAAARLLDDVEYDDEDEPTNLKDRIEAAKAEFGEDAFKGATPAAPGGADQGAREGAKEQLSSTEGMSPEEIAKATEEGRLDEYLKKPKN